ncbi:QueT transporter family protein [Metabacillus sp. KIGAM252]|uniref:QueT transporter family protein n=1 Tax=Metabacillus flavus TaxID=2823519 RepID=A0ABS5LAR7_9BACI|nr:QueT transporter family protein [Metabacillus flavus]MBS2967673.1 QueT transporter family protein [Metabacillus flavus]
MNIRTLSANAILAAIYIAVSTLIQPIAFSNIQFRIPEMLNHLVVFNKKYIYGIVLGVFISNLIWSPMKGFDLIFGTGQSVIALLITILASKYIRNTWALMAVNTLVFTFTMFIIAWELHIALGFPFWITWATTAAGEFVVMAAGMPIIQALNKRLRFDARD